MNLYVDVEVKTDACLASGGTGGVGDVNTATEMDTDGMPILRGRTLKGLIVEEAAAILEMAGSPAALVDAASVLFGDPGRHGVSSLLSFADGSVPPRVRETFKENGWDQQALTCVRRQTAIDPDTGAARIGSLRAARLIRAGVILRCTVRSARDLISPERALLAACVASIRRIGLHRNEGWGRVQCRLRDGQGVDRTGEWVAELDSEASAGKPVEPHAEPETDQGVVHPSASPGRTVVEFDVDLERPLVLPDRAAGDWETMTLSYLPGSALLGACATRWLAATRCDDAAVDERFRRVFLDGSVRWLNAYPLDGEVRALPAPRSWRIDDPEFESSSAQVLDLAHPEGPERLEGAEPGAWKPFPAATFEVVGAERVRLVRPRTKARLHHEREREAGRSEDGDLFVLDALDAGQRFRGAVLCESGADAEIVRSLLQGAILDLGRSRTATYGGGARITARIHPAESWSEADLEPSARVLVLASDYLGRNERGTPDPAALLAELAHRLGLAPGALARAHRYLAHRVVHGNVGRWQMPRPAEVAVAAGSVVVLPPDVADDVDRDRLADVVWRGLGERRAEGFGRVLAVMPWEDAVMAADRAAIASAAPKIETFPDDDQLLTRVRRWVALQTLRTAMVEDATAFGATLRYAPPSLVARVRQEVRAASSLEEVSAFLRSIARKKAGKGLARVAEGRSFEGGVLPHCTGWRDKFRHMVPRGASMSDVERDAWTLQQTWLDAVLERWRRAVQKDMP